MAISFPRDLPAGINFEASRFGLNVNQSTFSSDISRKQQVQQHAGGMTDRWEGLLTTPTQSPAQIREITTYLMSLRGREGTILIGNPDQKTNAAGTLGNLLSADSLDIVNSTSATFKQLWTQKPLYLLDVKPGQAISSRVAVKSDTGADRVRHVITEYDISGGVVATTNSNAVTNSAFLNTTITNLVLDAATHSLSWWVENQDVSENATIQNARLNRGASFAAIICGVNGASQTGRTLNLDRLPVDTKNILLTGDFFNFEDPSGKLALHRLVAPLDSDGSGQGALEFEPAIRISPADNVQVLFENTRCLARMAAPRHDWETDVLGLGVVSFAWEEVV
jgi:hypothetical protein